MEYNEIWEETTYFVSKYSEDGYVGRTANSSGFTDWCIEKYASEKDAEERAKALNEAL